VKRKCVKKCLDLSLSFDCSNPKKNQGRKGGVYDDDIQAYVYTPFFPSFQPNSVASSKVKDVPKNAMESKAERSPPFAEKSDQSEARANGRQLQSPVSSVLSQEGRWFAERKRKSPNAKRE
jgi:hypothetical protein